MMMVQAFDLSKEFQGAPVLTGVTFQLAAGDRVGLVGPNGCGKSTLLKILAGEMEPQSGRLHWGAPRLTRAYLSQADHFDPRRTLGEQLAGVPDDLLARCGIDPAWLTRQGGALSGGQKTRAALARTLATRPDVLLLDEPTNHLDAAGLTWLEGVLKSYQGAVLVVSHDRWFLDQVATRIFDLTGGQVREYPGNYSAYARQKELEQETAREEYRQYVKQKKQLEEAIRRQRSWAESVHNEKVPAEAKMAKAARKAQGKAHMQTARAMEQRLERIRVEKPRDAEQIRLRVDGQGNTGRNLVLAENLGFRYCNGPWLFRSAGFYVQRGDRVAVTGPNGAGKSTLLKLLLGEVAPTEGSVYRSPVRVAYLAQELETLNPANTVLEEATGNAAADQAEARTLLGCLLFSGEDVRKPVAVLSGGERVRLALVKILLGAPDLLVLDEPTNHLDLPSRERVEEALADFGGTLLLVSHDRYLLRRLAGRVLHVEGGRIEPFTGGYEAFLERRQAAAAQRTAPAAAGEDPGARRILLEMRLAQLSARLGDPKAPDKESLNAEFLAVSRELRALKGAKAPLC